MEPRLKAFLSSAQFQGEFAIEREGLPAIFSKQPLAAGFVLWRIEDTASPKPPEQQYAMHVADSDLLILLLGEKLRSAVVDEYHLAASKRIPVFAFMKQVPSRDAQMVEFIKELETKTTYTNYSTFAELVEKLEDSILTYYYRGSMKEEVLEWRAQRSRHKKPMQEERSLRLLAGILVSDAVNTTQTKVIDAILLEALLTTSEPADKSNLIAKAMQIVSSDAALTRAGFVEGLESLIDQGIMQSSDDNKVILEKSMRDKILAQHNALDEQDTNLFLHLYERSALASEIDLPTYRRVVAHVIIQVVYDTAVTMVEQEFGTNSNPFGYDADEINRIVADALTNIDNLPQGGIGKWQSIIVSVLQSDDPAVITWLNRLRKAYWALTVLGMDPGAIKYTSAHLKNYCVYLDSHIVLRAMVQAGGESQMCQKIVALGRKLNVEMRLSSTLFNEVQQAFIGANEVYYSASRDIPRALEFLEAVHRRSDIFDGFLAVKTHNPACSWDAFMNRFYSPLDEFKLRRYIQNELGVLVQPDEDFSNEQHGRIEDITRRLLEKRSQIVRPPKNLSEERRAAWERQYLLRTNEARQMAIVYELRHLTKGDGKQYWFVTFDEFVYDVSAALVADGDRFYSAPCYMQPATWLQIMANASPDPLSINMFREILLSRDVQQVADQLESEVISQMLKSRIDQDIKNIDTLLYMFSDIINRPAVVEAYEKALKAEGIEKLTATDRVKDKIIDAMQTRITKVKEDLNKVKSEAEVERRRAARAEGKADYLKRQLRLKSQPRGKRKH